MENIGYLFAVFAIVWAALFVYIYSLVRRQQQLRREIDALEGTPEKETG